MKYFWMLLLLSLFSCTAKLNKPVDYVNVQTCGVMWYGVYYPNIQALVKMCIETNHIDWSK